MSPSSPSKLKREDHDAVVCFFLEIFDFHNRACEVGLMHWREGHHADFKTSIRAKWGGEDDQSPDESFNVMFRRGREILEERFPDEVARLRDVGLSIEDVEYDDLRTSYPTEDDERDHRHGTYDEKALLCFFMEVFEAQQQEDDFTHWTEGEYEDLKASIDPSWVEDDGEPDAKFTRMTRRGLDIVAKAFPETFERLAEHDITYEPREFGDL